MEPSYSRRLRQITRSEWEPARGRTRLNIPGSCIYETTVDLVPMTVLTGMKYMTVDENKSRVFDVFDRTTVRVVKDNIISNR